MSRAWIVRGLIGLAALGTYLACAAAALQTPPTTAPADPSPATLPAGDLLPIRAVGMQLQRTDWIDRYKASIDEIADLGADAVKLVVDARQEDGSSNVVYLDLRRTPSAENLAEVIRHAKGRGLKVILMPIVLLDDGKGAWRGTLAPESWAKWFASYRDMLGHFAWIADSNGVDVFVIGSELLSSEAQDEEWTETIAFVRERFGGLITYSSNWDHYHAVPFWDDLDLIGMNSYWTLGGGGNATVGAITRNWQPIKDDLRAFVADHGKPLLFLEIGWTSLDNAASAPWDYTQPDPINLDLQKRLYTAFFDVWHGTPWLGGYSVWEWPPGDGGPDDRGYTPENKPAAEVLAEQLRRPAWRVSVGGAD